MNAPSVGIECKIKSNSNRPCYELALTPKHLENSLIIYGRRVINRDDFRGLPNSLINSIFINKNNEAHCIECHKTATYDDTKDAFKSISGKYSVGKIHYKICHFFVEKDDNSQLEITDTMSDGSADSRSAHKLSADEQYEIYNKEYKHIKMREISFASWPSSAGVQNKRHLAEAGWINDYGYSAICFSCNGKARFFDGPEDPWIVHALSFRNCTYLKYMMGDKLINKIRNCARVSNDINEYTKITEEIKYTVNKKHAANGYVPCDVNLQLALIKPQKTPNNQYNTSDVPLINGFDDFNVRISSYQGWPGYLALVPKDMAEAGWYFMGFNDFTQCFHCGGRARDWENHHNPLKRHKKLYPKCKFLVGKVSSQSLEDVKHTADVPHDAIQQLTLTNPEQIPHCKYNTTKVSRHSVFDQLRIRVSSYQGWPSYLALTPRDMALAGWYHAGYNDVTVCYHCGGVAKDWEDDDIPLERHKSLYPECKFLVGKVVSESSEKVNREQSNYAGNKPEEPINDSVQRQDPEDSEDSEDEFESPQFKKILKMGYTKNQIMDAMEIVIANDINSGDIVKDILSYIGPVAYWSSTSSQGDANTMANTSSQGDATVESLQEENRRRKLNMLCKICTISEKNIMFLPCNHLLSCEECAPKIKICPECDRTVQGTLKTYVS